MKQLRARAATAGYTVVELMMATSIFAVGVTGVVAMQISTASSNMHAKNVAVATALARSWQERLAMEATLWGQGSSWATAANAYGLNNTTWIQPALGGNAGTWIIPGVDTTIGFGPGADAQGRFINTVATAGAAYFCTHIRLTPIITLDGSGLVRAEVRVFWPSGPIDFDGNYCVNADQTVVGQVGASFIGGSPGAGTFATAPATGTNNQFHFVYKTSAIRETPAL